MNLGKGVQVRLRPEDEYNHPIEAASNFNESMYINLFDHRLETGGWFRVGNRPNEGHAEVSFCYYLPNGQVAFAYFRPPLDHNRELNAAGMKFEIIEPLKKLRLTFEGEVCLLDDPQQMENPKQAFLNNPKVKATADLVFTGFTEVYGGEALAENGNPVEENPDESFALAHYEQHMAGEGTVTIGDTTFTLNGFGLRDHSWGPRYWQNLYWYRWLPMVFSEQLAMNITVVQMASGKHFVWGMVHDSRDGTVPGYDLIESCELVSTLDDKDQAQAQTAKIRTEAGREYTVTGKALSLIPLRNRRQTDQGEWRVTRITEAMSRFECDGEVGYGMSEYLDQIVDGVPVGKHC